MLETMPLMPEPGELPDALRALRKDQYRKFVWAYVFGTGANGAAAARFAGYSDHMERCKVTAHHLLQRDDIQDAIRALCSKYLFSLAPKAILRLEQLLDNPQHPKHDKAIDMALSRSGHGEKTQIDVNVTGKVELNHTDAALADLRQLIELGVSREKLIEVFGFSGLERYEKMLKSPPKVIEHDG